MTDAMLPGLFQRLPICVIGYVRVSDKSQLRGASLETQATALRKYCTERGWVLLDIVEEVYRGYYLAKRQKLSDSVRAFVRAKKIHAVVVNSLDRLSRNPIHQAVLLHEMEEHGVRLESVTEHLEASAVGSFLSQTIGFAAIEREKILERSTRGIQSRVDKGQMLGGGMPLYGYNWGDEKHTHYVIVPGEAAIVYEVYERYTYHGESLRSIARWLNDTGVPTRFTSYSGKPSAWCVNTIRNMIEREDYTGRAVNRRRIWRQVDGVAKGMCNPDAAPLPGGVVPRIVEDELWNAAQMKRSVARAELPRNNKVPEVTLLRSGYIMCGYCGKPMSVRRATTYFSKWHGREKTRQTQYWCNNTNVTPELACSSNTTIVAHLIDDEVWKFVTLLLEDLGVIREILQTPLQNNAEAELKSIESLIASTKEDIARRVEDMLELHGCARQLMLEKLKALEDGLEELEKLKINATPGAIREEGLQHEIEAFLQWCESLAGRYEESTYEEKRRALRHLGIRVRIYRHSDKDHPHYVITARPEFFEQLKKARTMQNLNSNAKEMSESNLFCEQQGFHLSTCYP